MITNREIRHTVIHARWILFLPNVSHQYRRHSPKIPRTTMHLRSVGRTSRKKDGNSIDRALCKAIGKLLIQGNRRIKAQGPEGSPNLTARSHTCPMEIFGALFGSAKRNFRSGKPWMAWIASVKWLGSTTIYSPVISTSTDR